MKLTSSTIEVTGDPLGRAEAKAIIETSSLDGATVESGGIAAYSLGEPGGKWKTYQVAAITERVKAIIGDRGEEVSRGISRLGSYSHYGSTGVHQDSNRDPILRRKEGQQSQPQPADSGIPSARRVAARLKQREQIHETPMA